MAAKKPKKTTTKKNTGKGARASAAQPRDVAKLHRRNQVISWSLLGLAAVLEILILVPLGSVLNWIHNGILGMFGFLSFLFPVLLGYVGILIAKGQSAKPRTTSRTILIFAMVVIACTLAYAIGYGNAQQGQNYFNSLGELFQQGMHWRSAGLFSGLLGIPIVALCSTPGTIIIMVVMLLVALAILTGISVLQVRDALAKPTRKVMEGISEGISNVKVAAEERREERRAAKEAAENDPVPTYEEQEQMELVDIPLDADHKEQVEAANQRRAQEKKRNLYRAFHMPFEDEMLPEEPEASVHTPENQPAGGEQEAAVRPVPPKKAKKVPQNDPFAAMGVDVEDLLDIPMGPMEAAKPMPKSVQKPASKPAAKPAPKAEPVMELTGDDGAATAAAAFAKKLEETQTRELEEAASVTMPDAETVETYRFPPIELLKSGKAANADDVTMELQINGQKLVEVLKSFGVQTRILDISRGPAVTRYELQPAAGVKISKITSLSDDIAMNLAASGVRIEAPIPGKAAVGVEVPNQNVSVVKMRELVESAAFQKAKSKLTVALGRDISGEIVLGDLAKMPHVLIAGATGSGKSVCINSLIISLLYKATPDEVKLLMVDPKVVELGIYNGIPHLLVPVVTDPRKAAGALSWAVNEMLNRYKTFADNNVRDLRGYNAMVGDGLVREDGVKLERMAQIVIIIDELADLMMAAPHEVEDSICRLAQMARAAGMHLVIATQRPSVDVITGVIKANIPSRVAFAVSSQVDSRTILDSGGAEKLLGRGDMLFAPSGAPKPMRVQGCFVEDKEVEQVVSFVKGKHESDYDAAVLEQIEKNAVEAKSGKEEESNGISSDPMMPEAIKVVVEAGQASTSLLQRRLRLGYARAGRLIDEMEQMGVVGPHEGSKPRQVLISYQDYLEMSMQQNDARNDAQAEDNGSVPDELL